LLLLHDFFEQRSLTFIRKMAYSEQYAALRVPFTHDSCYQLDQYGVFRSLLPSAAYLPTHGLRPTEIVKGDAASHVRSEKSSQVADATSFDVRCGSHGAHHLCRCGNEREYAEKSPKPCVLGVF
jgi:hypothetical protein